MSGIVWKPTDEYIERANITKFMIKHRKSMMKVRKQTKQVKQTKVPTGTDWRSRITRDKIRRGELSV